MSESNAKQLWSEFSGIPVDDIELITSIPNTEEPYSNAMVYHIEHNAFDLSSLTIEFLDRYEKITESFNTKEWCLFHIKSDSYSCSMFWGNVNKKSQFFGYVVEFLNHSSGGSFGITYYIKPDLNELLHGYVEGFPFHCIFERE